MPSMGSMTEISIAPTTTVSTATSAGSTAEISPSMSLSARF